jgi:hypothetical protein
MSIPKIFHQIWVGPKKCPLVLTESWKEKYSNYEYILWNEDEIKKRGLIIHPSIQEAIDKNNEWNGKADIYRWLILYQFGGVFQDIDSICIEQIPEDFLKNSCFSAYENEKVRTGLVATGTMGFIPNHELIRDIIEYMKTPTFLNTINCVLSWQNCGPGILTDFLNTGKYSDFVVYPSYYFLPIHHTGVIYEGHKKSYAHQLWCTNFQAYSSENYHSTLPEILLKPKYWVSVLISSYNTEPYHIKECLDSILLQEGNFGMEIVWINDGSDFYYTKCLKEKLEDFKNKSRFCKIIYNENDKNRGTCFSLNKGVLLCSNELIIKMDSDDIMKPNRINTQILFMKNNPNIPFCSANITLFKNPNNELTKKEVITSTKHKDIIYWNDFIKELPEWFSNHCCMCFRKEAILTVGNYNIKREPQSMMEDFELELKLLKKYGKMCNIQDVLLYYRIHEEQLTNINKSGSPEMVELRNKIIYEVMNN